MSIASERGLSPDSAHGPDPGLHQSPGGVASRLRVWLFESLLSQLHLPSPHGVQLLVGIVPCAVGGSGKRVNVGGSGRRINAGGSGRRVNAGGSGRRVK